MELRQKSFPDLKGTKIAKQKKTDLLPSRPPEEDKSFLLGLSHYVFFPEKCLFIFSIEIDQSFSKFIIL